MAALSRWVHSTAIRMATNYVKEVHDFSFTPVLHFAYTLAS